MEKHEFFLNGTEKEIAYANSIRERVEVKLTAFIDGIEKYYDNEKERLRAANKVTNLPALEQRRNKDLTYCTGLRSFLMTMDNATELIELHEKHGAAGMIRYFAEFACIKNLATLNAVNEGIEEMNKNIGIVDRSPHQNNEIRAIRRMIDDRLNIVTNGLHEYAANMAGVDVKAELTGIDEIRGYYHEAADNEILLEFSGGIARNESLFMMILEQRIGFVLGKAAYSDAMQYAKKEL